MGRWEPDAQGRLQQAALVLFVERGFEQTTVADIARLAGVTERTFFRHFADKREVLFAGQDALRETFVTGIAAAPVGASPRDVMIAALDAAASFFRPERRPFARDRHSVIEANPSLQERELLKLAGLAAALADALRARGVDGSVAGLTGETAMAVFKVSFLRWITDPDDRDLLTIQHQTLAALTEVTTPS